MGINNNTIIEHTNTLGHMLTLMSGCHVMNITSMTKMSFVGNNIFLLNLITELQGYIIIM